MRAVVIERPQAIAIVETTVPSPRAHEVLVRMAGSGVCGSNVPVFEGRPWFSYPLEPGAPGHEGWGVVERVGDAVEELTAGTPVALLSDHAFAQFDVTDASRVVPIPPSLSGKPFPGEAVACAVNVVRRARVSAGQHVAVIGIGFLGAVVTRLCTLGGARVTAISRRRFALDRAVGAGAAAVVPLIDTTQTVSDARAVNGRDFDVVIEATGLQQPLDIASQLTSTRGRLVIAGYHQDGTRNVDMQLWNWRGIDVINAHERDPRRYVEAMREAARLVASGDVSLDELVTHVFSLDDAGDAFRCAVERPDGFLKAAVVMHAA